MVVLMGLRQIGVVAKRLVEAGWSATTPVAVVQSGTTDRQKTVEGTLQNIEQCVRRVKLKSPALILLGQCIRHRKWLNWFERLPLYGKTILITRSSDPADKTARLLEEKGARTLISPAQSYQPILLNPAAQRRFKRLDTYDGIVFTSVNAVRFFVTHWKKIRRPWPLSTRVYAVGPKTRDALIENEIPVFRTAKQYASAGVVKLFGTVKGKIFLLPRAQSGLTVVYEYLRLGGARADLMDLYKTKLHRPVSIIKKAVIQGDVDCALFASPSAAHVFLRAFPSKIRKRIVAQMDWAAIGPTTARALKDYGVRRLILPRSSISEGLVSSIAAYYGGRKKNK
jgi:uroporphyrinogen III methyltransferase/synthase